MYATITIHTELMSHSLIMTPFKDIPANREKYTSA